MMQAMAGVKAQEIRFGSFRLRLDTGELFKAGTRIALRPQAFQVLAALLQRPGELVTREELRTALWKSDTFVDYEHSINVSVNKIRELLGDSSEQPRYIETLPRRGYRFRGTVEFDSPAPIPEPAPGVDDASIAVLPFVDMSAGADFEFFGDGLAEEIINALAQAPELKVTARTSAFAFKGRTDDIRTIGRALNVSHILEGSVRFSGSHVRVTAQLIKTVTGYHVWSKKYDSKLMDLLTIQDEIAQVVARTLRVHLAPTRMSGQSGSSTDPEAWMLVLKGRFYLRKYSDPWKQKAKACFDSAIALDPASAAAHLGLAHYYLNPVLAGNAAPLVAYAQVRRLVPRIIELDPGLAEARSSYAFVLAFCDYDWDSANMHLERALSAAPNSVHVQIIRTWVLSAQGRGEEAMAAANCARTLSPLDPYCCFLPGEILWMRGEYERSIQACRDSLELDANQWLPYITLGGALGELGRLDEAFEALDAAGQLYDMPWTDAYKGRIVARAGRQDDARALLMTLRRRREIVYTPASSLCWILYGLREWDAVFDNAEAAMDERDFFVHYLVSESFADLRDHPRFPALCRRMNIELPTPSQAI